MPVQGCTLPLPFTDYMHYWISYYRGADKSLARPGRKQATAIKLLQATQKNSEVFPFNRDSGAAMTSALDEKWDLSIVFLVGSG